MRLVKWDEFKTLPNGTIFQDYSVHHLGTLNVLGGVLHDIDFVSAELLPSCGMGDSDPCVIKHPSGFGRDGYFDLEKRTWLIWEDADRKRLADWLLGDATKGQNDDGMIYQVPLDIVDAI
jgi:hypothetical protein